eukprot:TRINITY_DN2586_c0_g1_i2.p1 TRINITY_DN2586_c0_g1~~TRINITY_DN2586_c0_g1_i2.p1  ORF type:complete len:604 (+),score=85.91 TRINITY_DN2586_c0_g1_i2:45-1856(+)
MMASILRKLYDKYLHKEGEAELESIRKKIMAPTAVCVVLASTVLMLALILSGRGTAYIGMLAVFIVAFGFGLATMLVTQTVSNALIVLLIMTSNVGCIWGDFLSSVDAGNFRLWPMMLLNLDLLILCKVPAGVISTCLFSLLLWMAVTVVEDSRRFGLYDIDIPGMPSYATRIELCTCEHPPCPIGELDGALRMCFFSFVILLQFYFMTKVSQALNAEKDRVGASVKTTNNIARYLRQYDLRRAGAILEEERDVLPSGLLEAFHTLISNLERYKPFLPQSCFAEALPVSDIPDEVPESSEEKRRDVVESFLPSILQTRSISILIINVADSLGIVSRDRYHFEYLCENLLSVSAKTINSFDGMIDTFHGDHIQASWNGVKRCILNTTKSARASVQINEDYRPFFSDKINFGIASGRADCGDLGTSDLKRYSIVSGIHNWANAVERAGRSLGIDILCDSATRAEASLVLPIRANIQRVSFPKRGTAAPAILWEIISTVSRKQNPAHSNSTVPYSEWMYEVQSDFMQSIELYNRVVVAYLEGNDVKALAEELEGDDMSYVLRERLHKPPPAVLSLAFPNASDFLANNDGDQFSSILSESLRSAGVT